MNLVAIGLDVATHFDVNLTENDIAALDKSDKMEARFLRLGYPICQWKKL